VAVLDRAPSGSGARYRATLDDGDYLFWNKGDEATFEAPGVSGPLTCSLGPGG
jgi:membrane-bound inhibitor of C-type lysozyme